MNAQIASISTIKSSSKSSVGPFHNSSKGPSTLPTSASP